MQAVTQEDPPKGKFSIVRLFDLRRDQGEAQDIDADVRAGVRVAGTNLWVLFFAILTASVGLNVNSTASIIGAMLISPLMGPIVGIGYGAGVNDFALVRQAARNLFIFATLSLVTSTLYFTLSPLNEVGSELLARTSPTIWDVLIAFFGGLAGVIALTRRSISNVVPGVAIATALMPPLCTAGFGLAHGRWEIFAGAFYLFVINGVFIATATLVIVKGLKLPQRVELSEPVRARTRAIIATGLVVVLGPSLYLGWRLVNDEIFNQKARQVVSALKADERFTIIEAAPDARARILQLTVVGDRNDPGLQASAQAFMERAGMKEARLDLRFPSDVRLDGRPMARQDADRDDYARVLVQQGRDKDARIKALEDKLRARDVDGKTAVMLQAEIQAQLPSVSAVTFAQGRQGADSPGTNIVVLHVARPLGRAELDRMHKWLAVRLAGGGPRRAFAQGQDVNAKRIF